MSAVLTFFLLTTVATEENAEVWQLGVTAEYVL